MSDRLNLKDARRFLDVGPVVFARLARERGWIAEPGPYRQKFYRLADLKAVRPDGKLEVASEPVKRRERPCLRCRKPFPSEGAHNRLCNPCKGYALTVRSNFDE